MRGDVPFHTGRGGLVADAGGTVRASSPRRPGLDYITVDGAVSSAPTLVRTGVAVDEDEVELTFAAPDSDVGLRMIWRHGLVAGWRMRVVVANVSDRPVHVTGLTLPVRTGPDCAGWALAAEADAVLFVQPRDGMGPMLAGRLRRGSVAAIDAGGLHLPDLDLGPGARYVLAWDWEWYADPRDWARARPGLLPPATVAFVGQSLIVPASPDVALVGPNGVAIEDDEDHYELISSEPASHRVELHSARGATAYTLRWVPTIGATLAGAAAGVLAVARERAGVPGLVNVDQALVVQRVLGAGLLDPALADSAADALDGYTARCGPSGSAAAKERPADPLVAAYLAGEYERTGEAEPLEAATAGLLLALDRPAPGLGVAATRVLVGRLLAGWSIHAVAAHLTALAATVAPAPSAVGPPGLPAVSEQEVAAAELLLVTLGRTAGASESPASPELHRLIRLLGWSLGAGLPGQPLSPWPTERLAHVLTVLGLVPERLSESVRPEWGRSVTEVVDRSLPGLIARLGSAPAGRAHAWLALLAGLS